MTLAYRITALDRVDEIYGGCFAESAQGKPCNFQHCSGSRMARYRCEAISPETGEVTKTSLACINHAAWLAHQVGIAFPLAQPSTADSRKQAA
jgi:hypothetical protein